MSEELTVTEVAEILGVTVQAVGKYLREQKLLGYKVGGHWRVSRQAVYDFLELSNSKLLGGKSNE